MAGPRWPTSTTPCQAPDRQRPDTEDRDTCSAARPTARRRSRSRQDELYAPLAAIKIAKGGSKKKFDETVDVAMRLGVDPRKADQMVRGTVNLPHGTGKTARVLVFAERRQGRGRP